MLVNTRIATKLHIKTIHTMKKKPKPMKPDQVFETEGGKRNKVKMCGY